MKLKFTFAQNFYKKITTKKSKQRFILVSKIGAILLLFGGAATALGWSSANIQDNLHESIEYHGGYKSLVQVYDYNKAFIGNSPASGNNRDYLAYLKNKLNPLGDQYYNYQYVGANQLLVATAKDNFKNLNAFNDVINRNGGLTLMTLDSTLKDKGFSWGKDLLVSYDDKKKVYNRAQITSVLNDPKSTVDTSKQPILQFTTGGRFSKLVSDVMTKAGVSAKLYLWKNIGMVLDYLRKDYSNFSNYQTIINTFNNWTSNIPITARTKARQLFDYSYSVSSSTRPLPGNFLDRLPGSIGFEEIVKNNTFKWSTVSQSDLQVNPNSSKLNPNALNYVMPWEPTILQLYSKESFAKTDLEPFLLNNYQITKDKKMDFKNVTHGFNLPMESESSTDIAQNTILGNFKGAAFQTISSTVIDPIVSSAIFLTTVITLGVLLLIFGIYLMIEFRIFGFLVFFDLLTTIISTIYVSSLLSVNLSPISIAGFIVIFIILLSGMILIARRYKTEKILNRPPNLTCLKIALRQRLPYFIDGLVVFLILALSFFAFSSGPVKSFSISLLIALLIGVVLLLIFTLTLFYLFIKTELFTKIPVLDMQRNLTRTAFRIIRTKVSQKASLKTKKSVDKVDVSDIMQQQIDNEQTSNRNDTEEKNESNKDSNILSAKKEHKSDLHIVNKPKKSKSKKMKAKAIKSETSFKVCFSKFGQLLKTHISFYQLFKWSPLILLIFIAVATTLVLTGQANLGQSLSKGTNFNYYSLAWQNDDGSSKQFTWEQEKNYIETAATQGITSPARQVIAAYSGWSSANVNFLQGPGNTFGSTESLLISTSLNKNDDVIYFRNWLRTTMQPGTDNLGDYTLKYTPTNPTTTVQNIEYIFTAIGVGSAITLVYIIFRYDWGQMIVILTTGVFSLLMAASIIVIVHIPLTMSVLVLIGGLWCFAVVNSCFVMSRASENKKKFDITAYQNFFRSKYDYQVNKTNLLHDIKYNRRRSIKARAKKIRIDNPILSKKNSFFAAKELTQVNHFQYKAQVDMNKNLYRNHKKTFRGYNRKHNFLYKAAATTFRGMLLHALILSILALFFTISFVVFGSTMAGFFIAVLISILSVLYTSLIIGIPLWVKLEEIRSLNRVRFHKYLREYKTNVDEQEIAGVNNLE